MRIYVEIGRKLFRNEKLLGFNIFLCIVKPRRTSVCLGRDNGYFFSISPLQNLFSKNMNSRLVE